MGAFAVNGASDYRRRKNKNEDGENGTLYLADQVTEPQFVTY